MCSKFAVTDLREIAKLSLRELSDLGSSSFRHRDGPSVVIMEEISVSLDNIEQRGWGRRRRVLKSAAWGFAHPI